MKMTEFVTPHLRTVLKTYQNTATKSLQGPGLLTLGLPLKKEILSPDINDEPLLTSVPMPPEISQPILSEADTGRSVLCETILEGKLIGCFLLGGEMRLCIPQILNNVLKDFTLDEINATFDKQRIFCSQCTPEQLIQFKAANILPELANTSGLITRTNAERLCSKLLHRPEGKMSKEDVLSCRVKFRVFHHCFGKTEGICMPELYTPRKPACIKCDRCDGLYSPQKFVCHDHTEENSTIHWGFDSNNWRAYLQVHWEEKNRDEYSKMLDTLRDRQLQDPIGHIYSQQNVCTIKRKAVSDNSLMTTSCKQEPLDIPLKKAKQMEESYLLSYHCQKLFEQYHHHHHHQYAFRPWQHPSNHIPPHMAFPPNIPYLNQEPPVLQNPERVVRLSECERFERSFQPNVALAPRKTTGNNTVNSEREKIRLFPANIQIKQERPPSVSPELRVSSPINQTSPPPISPEGHSGSNEITSSTSPVPVPSHKPSHATEPNELIENHHSRVQPQPLSVLTNGTATNLTTNSELELSTDTDDDDSLTGEPDSSNNSASWDIAVEALKDTKSLEREKVLQIIKTLVNENAQFNLENSKLLHEMRCKEEQIAELQHQLLNQQQNQLQQVTIRPVETSSIMVDIVNRTFRTSDKSETEVIRMPLKKSVRRSPEASSVVIMQTNKIRDDGSRDQDKHECITRFDTSLQNGKMLELVQTVDD